MYNLRKRLQNEINKIDTHTLEVVKKSSSSIVVKVLGMLFSLLISVALGRILGPDGLGIINLSTQITTILLTFCLFGMKEVVIKYVAIEKSEGDLEGVGNVMYTAYLFNGIVSLVISTVFILFSSVIANEFFGEPRLQIPLVIAVIVLTPQVLSRIFSSALIGYHKIWQSNLVDKALSMGVTGILLLIIWSLDYEITVNIVAILYAIGNIVVMITMLLYWRTLYTEKFAKKFRGQELLKTAFPFLIVSLSAILLTNISPVILGWLGNSREVGIFMVASRVALLTSFFVQVTNAATSPKLASLYAENRIEEMERMVQQVTIGLSVIGIVMLVFLVIWGDLVLSLWGEEFIAGYWALLIISVGQFFNIATGAAGSMLNMCGFEKEQRTISIVAGVLNLLANYFLIMFFGIIGAAIATAVTTIGQNIARLIIAKTKVGISTVVLFK